MEGKLKYFHSKTFLGLTDTIKSKLTFRNEKQGMIMTQNATVKKNQNEIYKMIIIAQCIYEGT